MGRTLPSATQLILEEFDELKPLYQALRRCDQLIFDKFFEAVYQHRDALDHARNLLPMEMIRCDSAGGAQEKQSHFY